MKSEQIREITEKATEQLCDTGQAETLLRALASQYGGDPAATDISRLLRLPGFTNRKYNVEAILELRGNGSIRSKM